MFELLLLIPLANLLFFIINKLCNQMDNLTFENNSLNGGSSTFKDIRDRLSEAISKYLISKQNNSK